MIGTILKANITEGPKTDLIRIKTVTKCRKNNNFNDFFFFSFGNVQEEIIEIARMSCFGFLMKDSFFNLK